MSKLLFFDLETTGVKFWRNGIHQIGGIVDIDGQETERFDIRLANCMDVYVMVTPFLMGVRNDMENFKLMTVARTMGIEIDENKLHDATYDIELTRDIFYRIIGKMDVKL